MRRAFVEVLGEASAKDLDSLLTRPFAIITGLREPKISDKLIDIFYDLQIVADWLGSHFQIEFYFEKHETALNFTGKLRHYFVAACYDSKRTCFKEAFFCLDAMRK